MYLWAGAVALAVVAGAWAATRRPGARPDLPLQHVAGATLVGLFGWQMLVYLPGSVLGYWTLTAGLPELSGARGQQAYVVAQVVFVVAAALAVAGILRRRHWGAVLGIGLASAIVVLRVVMLVTTIQTFGGAINGDTYLAVTATSIGFEAVPALAALVLLLRPLIVGARPRAGATSGEWPATRPSPDRAG
jgi:hypothetical protein